MTISDDVIPLVTGNVKLYKRRWYILLVFSLVAVLQGEMETVDTAYLKNKKMSNT